MPSRREFLYRISAVSAVTALPSFEAFAAEESRSFKPGNTEWRTFDK